MHKSDERSDARNPLQALQKAQIEAYYVIIENLQKQVHIQQEMIDFMREEIEEMADAETASQ